MKRPLACLAACMLVGCSSAPSRALGPTRGAHLAPSGIVGLYYRFDGDGATRIDGDQARSWPLPPSAGRLLGVAYDLGGGRAAAVYEGGLGLVFLGEEGPPQWTAPPPWKERPEALAVRGEYAAALARDRVVLLDLRSPRSAYAVGSTELDGLELRPLLAIPTLEDPLERFVLVGWEPTARGGDVHVLSVSRADGTSATRQVVRDYTHLHAITTDGRDVFLAGVHQEQDRTTSVGGGFATLRETLLVDRVDLTDFTAQRLVRQDEHALQTRVAALAVGDGLVAVSYESRVLEIYDSRSGARLERSRHSEVPRVAWIAPRQLAVVTQGPPRILEL